LAIADGGKAALALLEKRGGEFGAQHEEDRRDGVSAGGHLAARLTHCDGGWHAPDFVVLDVPRYWRRGQGARRGRAQ